MHPVGRPVSGSVPVSTRGSAQQFGAAAAAEQSRQVATTTSDLFAAPALIAQLGPKYQLTSFRWRTRLGPAGSRAGRGPSEDEETSTQFGGHLI